MAGLNTAWADKSNGSHKPSDQLPGVQNGSAPAAENGHSPADSRVVFAVQHVSGITQFSCGSEVQSLEQEFAPADRDIQMVFSQDGVYFTYYNKAEPAVVVVDAATNAIVQSIQTEKVIDLALSPKGTYVVTYKREDRSNADNPNLHVYNTSTGEMVASFVQKRWPALQWSTDEAICVRAMNNQLYRVPGHDLLAYDPAAVLEQKIISFSMSSTKDPGLAVLIPSKGNVPGSVGIYRLPNLAKQHMKQDIPQVDSADMMWNHNGSVLIVHAKTDIDDTGRSYYGTSTLYVMMATTKQVWQVKLGAGEKVHDVQWAPNGQEFIVVYGEMPHNKATLFNCQAEPIHNFPTGPRNKVSWSPNGRLILIAGFGNLNGECDIWDRQKIGNKMIENGGKLNSMEHCSVTCHGWSPDSQYLVTSVTSPRMMVDNRIVVWKHNGTIHWQKDYNKDELFWVLFRPQNSRDFPHLEPKPVPRGTPKVKIGGKSSGAAKPTAVYRSAFSSSATSDAIKNYKSPGTSAFVARQAAPSAGTWGERSVWAKGGAGAEKAAEKEEEIELIPGMSPEMMAKMKKAKGEKKEKKEKREMLDDNGNPMSAENTKKVKALMKKIKDIEDLKKKDPAHLDANQKKKIETLVKVQKELADLKSGA